MTPPAFLARRPALAALLAGALAALALPPVHAVPVLLLAVPWLLALLGAAPGWRRAAWLGACFGFGHHVAGIYWVTHALFTDITRWWWLVPVAAPGLALPLAAFAVIPALAAWRAPPGWARALAFAGAWGLSEMLRGILFSGFPWNLWGTAWAFHALPLQPAAVVGAFGLSAVTALLAALPHVGTRAAGAAGAAVLALWAGFGLWRLSAPEPAPPGVTLALVQGNVAQDLKWDEAQRVPIFRRYLELTARAGADAPPGPLAVIWPETASPFLLAQDPDAIRLAAQALRPGATLLAGTVRAEWGADQRLSGLWNSLVALTDGGAVADVFDKFHLVPFGEYMPLGGLIPIRVVVGGMDFSAGPGPRTLRPPGLPPVSPLICYEVIFPGRVADGTDRPAWLLNVTNDAWFGVSAGPFQHFAAARLRAVEEGLPLARAAQTGISGVVDARGRVTARMGLNATGVTLAALPGAGPVTPAARFGRGIPLLLCGGMILLALGAAQRARCNLKASE